MTPPGPAAPVDQGPGTLVMTTERLVAFSDGVLAVASTLLVLDLTSPPASDQEGIWLFLGHQLPTLAAYVTSFLTILIFWMNHHTLFHTVKHVDRPSLFINGILLLAVSFISYATSVLGHALQSHSYDQQAAALYAGTLAVASACFAVLGWHLGRHPQLLHTGARAGDGSALHHAQVGPLLYVVTGAVALLSAPASLTADAGIAVYFAILPHRLSGRRVAWRHLRSHTRAP
jgi:uncharacterized membrane protein